MYKIQLLKVLKIVRKNKKDTRIKKGSHTTYTLANSRFKIKCKLDTHNEHKYPFISVIGKCVVFIFPLHEITVLC